MDLFPCHAFAFAQYTVYIYESLKAQPNHRGAGKHDPHLLSARLRSYSSLYAPSTKPYRQSLLHTARRRGVWLQWESPLSFECTCSPPFHLQHSTPRPFGTSPLGFLLGTSQEAVADFALVSTTSTEAAASVSVRLITGKINDTCSIFIPGAMPI